MRWLILCLLGLVFSAWMGLQGVAVHKSEDSVLASIDHTIDLYKRSAANTRALIKVAVKECLHERAGGKLPSYLTNYLADLTILPIRYAANNDIDTVEDPKVKKYLAKTIDSVERGARAIEKRIKGEPKAVQDRVAKIESWARIDGPGLFRCVTPKVARRTNGA